MSYTRRGFIRTLAIAGAGTATGIRPLAPDPAAQAEAIVEQFRQVDTLLCQMICESHIDATLQAWDENGQLIDLQSHLVECTAEYLTRILFPEADSGASRGK